jgi:hypothetical protein
MAIYVILMVLTFLAAIALLLVLSIYLNLINFKLASIGGTPYSFLAKIRVGLRAIKTETGFLDENMTLLNKKLRETSDGLKSVEGNLKETIDHVVKQEMK